MEFHISFSISHLLGTILACWVQKGHLQSLAYQQKLNAFLSLETCQNSSRFYNKRDDKLQYITWLYMVLCTGVTKTIFGLNRNLFEGDYWKKLFMLRISCFSQWTEISEHSRCKKKHINSNQFSCKTSLDYLIWFFREKQQQQQQPSSLSILDSLLKHYDRRATPTNHLGTKNILILI